MAHALFNSVIIVCVMFTSTDAAFEISPTRLVISKGESNDSIACTLKIPAQGSCTKPIQWIFKNETSGLELMIATIKGAETGPYMDYFWTTHLSCRLGPNNKECRYYLYFVNATLGLNGQYRCELKTQISDWVTAVVVPHVKDLQPKCNVSVTNTTHTVQDLELKCSVFRVNPSHPNISLVWMFRGERMPSTSHTSETRLLMTTKSKILPRNDSNSKMEYICRAYDQRGSLLENSCSITCSVNISIHVMMAYDSGRPEGTFRCPFRMSIQGVRYSRQWMLGGEMIDLANQTDRFFVEDRTGSLHMREILPSDNGKILSCQVNTMFGVYKAETLVSLEGTSNPDPKVPLDNPNKMSLHMIAIVAAGIGLVVFINAFVCIVIVKSRGKRSRTMNQPVATTVSQDQGLYASGIVPCNGYLHMNGTYAGSYDPEEPYQDMNNEGKRDCEYQVPKVNEDGSAIKKQQSVKYMNTLGGAKSKGFNVFRFSRRREEKFNKSDSLEGGACGGPVGPGNISPNCYDTPTFSCGGGLQVPSNKAQENDYDELNIKTEDKNEI